MDASTKQPGSPRIAVVASFYGSLAAVSFIAHSMSQENNDIWQVGAAQPLWILLSTPLLGAVIGVAIVRLFRILEKHQTWISTLHYEFQNLFGRPRVIEIVLLASASAIGEELFFRGFLLDVWGIWLSSFVFAVLHIPPRRSLWPWTLSSLLLGIGFAGLTLWTGNLGAAVAAHFVVNLQNLYYITRDVPRQKVPLSFHARIRQLDKRSPKADGTKD